VDLLRVVLGLVGLLVLAGRLKKPLAKPLRRQSRANRLAFSMFGLTEKAGRAHANRVPPGEADFPSVTRPIPLEDGLLDPSSAVTWRE